MKVQIISYKNELKNKFKDYDITYSTINSPQSFDEFDVNIILIQNKEIWRNKSQSKDTINCIQDFRSLQRIIQNSSTSKTIIAFPINGVFMYDYWSRQNIYQQSDELKNILGNVYGIISQIIPQDIKHACSLLFENTTTIINENKYPASFYFDTPCEKITVSTGSEKPTTIRYREKLYFTTLDFSTTNFNLKDFLTAVGLEQSNLEVSEWLVQFKCLDDEEQLDVVSENQRTIVESQNKIEIAKQKLDKNLKYKSILVTNGDELVSVVFDILEQILDYDLSEFEDEKREDFSIKKDGVTYIGEIKGITSNVRSEHISQLDVHYQTYLDNLQKDNIIENVKSILVINPFRTKPLSERDDIHENQIKLAIRNGSLIITTEALLKIYEMFLNGETTTEKILSVLSTETGLADINSFKQGD